MTHMLIFENHDFKCTCGEPYHTLNIDTAWFAHAAHMDGRGSE